MKFDINAIFPSGTPLENFLWILVLVAVLLNLWSWKRSAFLGLANIALIIVLAIFAMGAHPAHGKPYTRPRPAIVYPVPQTKPRPSTGRNQVCDNQCIAIGKKPGCKEKRLCYEGITR